MAKSGLVLGGVPTEPDVKKLIEAFPKLDAERLIEHAEIEKILGVDRTENRYRSVTNAWRRALKRIHNIDMKSQPGVGWVILSEQGRITESVRDFGRAGRRIVRAVTRARSTRLEKLTENQQRVAEHAIRRMEATAAQARADSKAIAVEFKPQDQLPRMRIAK